MGQADLAGSARLILAPATYAEIQR
jgi:hypothetical protein